MEKEEASASVRKSLATRLKQERDGHNWSQSELAARLGTTQVTISRWEQGLTVPGPYFRQRLTEVFGKPAGELGFVIEESHERVSMPETPAIAPTPALARNPIPYRRNALFTGREDILTALKTMLTQKKTAALTQAQAISGLGGIGKTQIAVEYAYRYGHHYQDILWVTASSRDRLIADFVMLADVLDLPEKAEQDQHIVVRAIKLWLSTTKTSWLLILDNVDDLEMIADVLPAQGMGDVLITTRLQALGPIAYGIEVEKMGIDEGVMFLLKRTKVLAPDGALQQVEQETQVQAAGIVAELDGLPLALDQAGAYMEETRCGFLAYRDLYRTRRKELLQRRGRFPVDHPESVTATWSLSFQNVEQESPVAADLLRLLAFLDPEAIPEEILSAGADELGPTLGSVVNDILELDAALGLLLRYSLLRRDPTTRLLHMHRLVQAVLKDSIEKDRQYIWAERAIRACNRAFPDVELATWPQCQRMLPQAQLSAQHLREYRLAFPEAARLLNQAANYLSTHAYYLQAEPLLQQAREICEQFFDPTHPATAATLNDLGSLYLIQGHYSQAEPLLQKAREIREQTLGLEHHDTAASLNNLASLYYAQGNYQRAEQLYQQALHTRQKVLAPEDSAIAQSQSNLAELYTAQGNYGEAEHLYLQAQASQEKTLGNRHPDVARTLNNLALLYRAQGQYGLAEQTFQRALHIQEQVLGPHHPDVAQTLYNLARLYRAQGKYPQSEPFYQRALSICQDVLGPDHPRVARILYGLAKLYNSQGKYRQAEALAQRTLTIQEQRLGIDHPEIAYTLGLLAKIADVQQQFETAVAFNRRALQIREQTSEANHPHIALLNNNLAELYHAQGKHREAEPFVRRSLAIHREVLGPDHPYMAYSLTNLAENLFLQKEYVQAEHHFKEAIALREQHLGSEHPRTAMAYHNLARLYHAQGRHPEADALYRQALAIREEMLGLEHPTVASSLEDYAPLLREMGQEERAHAFEARIQTIKKLRAKPEN